MKPTSTADKIILTLLFIPVYFVSLLEYTYRVVFISAGLIVLLLCFIVARNKKIFINLHKVLWLVAFIVVLVSMLIHMVDRLYLLFFATSVLLLWLYDEENTEWMDYSLKAFYIMGIFYSLMTLIQVFASDFYINNIFKYLRDNSTFDIVFQMKRGLYSGFTNQTAINAMYLSMGVGATYIMFAFGAKKKPWLLILIASEIACIILSGKRGHIIYVSVAILIVAYYNSSKSKRFTTALKVVLAIVVLLLLVYYLVPSASYFFDRVLNPDEDITNGRINRYIPAWELFRSHSIFGIGWERFRYTYIKYSDVHNIYLQLLCETGIIGTMIFLTLFMYSLADTIRIINYQWIKDQRVRKMLAFSLYTQIVFLLYGITGNGLYDYFIFFFYIIAILMLQRCKRTCQRLGAVIR